MLNIGFLYNNYNKGFSYVDDIARDNRYNSTIGFKEPTRFRKCDFKIPKSPPPLL